MPERQWQALDAGLWQSALTEGDVFDGAGTASHWRAKTVAQAKYAYGSWLQYLCDFEPDALTLPAASRLTTDRLRRHVESMAVRLSAVSIAAALGHLVLAMRAIAPQSDWKWLTRVQSKQLAIAKHRDKRPLMVTTDELVALGQSLMFEARADGTLVNALAYRDGLIISLLAVRPLRRSNFANLRLNKHVLISGSSVKVRLDGDEMKNGRAFECWLPALHIDAFLRYLNEIRPQFPRADAHDFLWCSRKGRALTPDGLYQMVVRRTSEAFGKRVYPHLFRDIAATAIATHRPEQVHLARDLLGHAILETTEKHYLHAQSVKAGVLYAGLVRSLRNRG